jgi:hypothetical protein
MAPYFYQEKYGQEGGTGRPPPRERRVAFAQAAHSYVRHSLSELCQERRDGFSLDVCEVKGSYTPQNSEDSSGDQASSK